MSNKYKTDWKLQEVTDEEIYDAIRYLEPEPSSEDDCDDSTAFAVGLSAVILLFGILGYFWPIP